MRKYSVEVGLGLLCFWGMSGGVLAFSNYVSIGMAWLLWTHPEFFLDYRFSIFAAFILVAPMSYAITQISMIGIYNDLEKRRFINKVGIFRVVSSAIVFVIILPDGLGLITFLETSGFSRITALFWAMIITGFSVDILNYIEWLLQAQYISHQPRSLIGRTS